MRFIDDAWGTLEDAAAAAGATQLQVVERLRRGELRGYQDCGGRIFVHKDEFIRLRDEREQRESSLRLARLMAEAHFERPADQALHEARLREQTRGSQP